VSRPDKVLGPVLPRSTSAPLDPIRCSMAMSWSAPIVPLAVPAARSARTQQDADTHEAVSAPGPPSRTSFSSRPSSVSAPP
jgi:hypothetical protein